MNLFVMNNLFDLYWWSSKNKMWSTFTYFFYKYIICSLPPWPPHILVGHPEFETLVYPPSKTLWIMVQAECTPFVWEKEALVLPSPFPFSNGRPPFQPVRHFPAPSPPPALCCYPVNWALPLEALIKSPNPLIRRKEEGWRETFPCSSLSMCPMALMLAVPLLVVNVVKKIAVVYKSSYFLSVMAWDGYREPRRFWLK